MEETNIALEMQNIDKSFPGVKALENVSIKVRKGTVHALMGENGAGKSTLMKCAFGIYHPDQGTIIVNGDTVHFRDTRDAMDKGVSMIHQELHPIRTRNVMENIWIGRIPYRKIGNIHFVDEKKMYADTTALFNELEIQLDPKVMVSELSVSVCQMLEIARAVSYGAKVIIMDEPTSSLTEAETVLLFKIVNKLIQQGVAIIYISHKMEEILKISDEVTIMRDGRTVGCWPASELTQDLIVKRMVGREITSRFPPKQSMPGESYLKIDHLTSSNPNSFRDICFDVRRGEILGIGGLVGAQRTELMESIFGLRGIASGIISINGKTVRIRHPREAIRNKMALLTEDRRSTGIIPVLSVLENMVMVKQRATPSSYKGFMRLLSDNKRLVDTRLYVDKLSIKTPSVKTRIKYLSGGNQQKVLLGRWLLTNPEILILDEPTRGIDVGAKYEIYSIMEQLAQAGKCIILISSEMPELMGMSDRILVMCEGRLSGILDAKSATDEKIMHLASTYTTSNGA